MNLNKTLEYAVYAGLFGLLFVPLIVSSEMFFPFITGKNFTFRILTEVLVALWAILALRMPEFRPKKSALLWSLGAFVGVMFLAAIFGENTFKSFWSNFERSEGWVTLLHLMGLFLVIGSTFTREKLWTYFFSTSIGVSAYLGIMGMRQLLGQVAISQSQTRIDTTFGNASYFAIYMVFNIFLLLYVLSRRIQKQKERGRSLAKDWSVWVLGLVLVLQLFALYHTATRGAILGLLGGVFLSALLIALFERGKKGLRKVAIGVVSVVVLVVALFFGIRNSDFVQTSPVLNRFANISYEEASSARFPVWNAAWQGFKERPILGWGQENFNYIFNKYYDPVMFAQEQWFDRAHNVVLDWLTTGGIFGFISYHSLFFFALCYLWKRPREGDDAVFSVGEKALFTGLLAAYYFHNIFVFDNIVSYIYFITLLAFIHARRTRTASENLPVEPSSVTKQITFAPIVLVGFVLAIIFFNIRGINQSKTLIDALVAVRSGQPLPALELFEEAYAYPYGGKQEVVEQLAQTGVGFAQVTDQSLREAYFGSSQEMLADYLERDPNNARLLLFAGSFYHRYGIYDGAEELLEEAVSLSPRKQTLMFELATVHLNKQEYDEAFEILKTAYELDTRFGTAALFYAASAIYVGDETLAEEILQEHFGTALVLDDRILRAYSDIGNFEKALEIADARIEEAPNNIQNYLSRAAVLLEVNRRNDAIADIERAIELDPNFKAQGEFYINEIQEGRNP